MPWAISSPGAMASANSAGLTPRLRSRQMPTSPPTRTPPQMPRPPDHTANGPYHTCGMSIGVVTSK